MTDFSDETKLVVHGIIAESRLADLKSYLERGRQYENMSDGALRKYWLKSVKAWGNNPFEPPTDMDDSTVEYGLRGIQPPYDLAVSDIDKASAAIKHRSEQMTGREQVKANAAMIANFGKGSRTLN